MNMWKPGQLVTIKGIVCRVKRSSHKEDTCTKCAFAGKGFCICLRLCLDDALFSVPYDCYLVRVSPIKKLSPSPRGQS